MTMPPLVVFLQNAWSPTPRQRWRRDLWLAALWASRTGVRLQRVLGKLQPTAYVANATAKIAGHPREVLPADPTHVAKILRDQWPWAVLACGAQAEAVCTQLWAGPLIAMPHPAYPVLTNRLCDRVRRQLVRLDKQHEWARLAYRQERGRCVELPLPTS